MATDDPIARFRRELAQAREGEVFDAAACVLATADTAGRPAARFVLLKDVDERGFVFYTNLGSRKAHELEANPRAALCFHWVSLGEQVRVEGPVERVSEAEADRYFATRARGSQLGAWASRQSEPAASREQLDAAFRCEEERFAGQNVPRPPFWGGYRIRPEQLEFWSSRDDRMHDRWLYRWVEGDWQVTRLQP